MAQRANGLAVANHSPMPGDDDGNPRDVTLDERCVELFCPLDPESKARLRQGVPTGG